MKLPTQHDVPRYAHACPSCGDCVWLGQHTFYDLYACRRPSRGGVVLVARYGVMSHDLASFALGFWRGAASEMPYPFNHAYELARQKGVVTAS